MTVSTQTDGTYQIPLYYGSFKLVFEKSGYVKQTRSLRFTYVLDVLLGPTTLRRGLSLTIGSSERMASPGTSLTVPFMVGNDGDREELVNLTASCRGNWTVYIEDEEGEVNAVRLNPGASTSLSLRLLIPVDVEGETEISVTARGRVEVVKTVKISIRGEPSHLMTCTYPSRQASPGGTVNFKVTLSNPSYLASEAKLQVKNLPTEWSSTILNGEGERVMSVYLPSGGSDEVTLRVEVPKTAQKGLYGLELEVTCGGRLDRAALSVEVESRVLALGIKTKYPFQRVELGKEVSFPVILENPGEADEVLSLSLGYLPEGWQGGFTTEKGAYILSLLLEAGKEETILAVFKPPMSAEPGNYLIRAKADSPNLKGELLLNVGLIGNMEMKMKIANLYDRLTVGEEKIIEVRVENTGYSTLTVVGLEASPSVESLKVQCDPLRVIAIESGETVVFRLRVTALEGTAQGDYLLDLKAVSEETSTQETQMRLTVQASGNQMLIVGAVIAAAFASVLLVYRKFKRR